MRLAASLLCLVMALPALAEEETEVEVEVAPADPPIRRNVPRLEIDFGGRIQTDLRFRVQEKCMGDWYDCRKLPLGISRNENIAKIKLDASVSRFKGVLDVDLVFTGVPDEPECFGSLSIKESVDPFHIEAHAAYIHARDLLFRGLDLRVGQQKVQWGVGDQFNPTNNLNADDLEDPLLFGEQQANLMVKLDYSPHPLWTFSGVLVPVFKPALLPPSGELALAATGRLPFNDPDFRHQIHSQNALSQELLGYPTRVTAVYPEYPDISARNMQFAFRIAGSIGLQDIAVSYYRGYEDFPVPYLNVGTLDTEDVCEYDDAFPFGREEPYENEECVSGFIDTETYLRYPRVQVLGFNWAGEIPVIGLGYRLELGVYFPQHMAMGIYNPEIPLFMQEGEYDYDNDGTPGGTQPEVLSDRNFAKWTLGLDYSIGPHVMLNAQWVHGMVDEFGAGDWMYDEGMAVRDGSVIGSLPGDDDGLPDLLACGTEGRGGECAREVLRPNLADYLVFGIDINFARDAALLRLFTLWDLSGYTVEYWDMDAGERVSEHYHPFTGEGFSAIIYPEFQFNFGHGFELHVGALLQLGKTYTKFGDPAGGGSQVFVRGRYSF